MPRANLPRQNVEIPLDEEVPELEPTPPLPEYRIPYTMHMVTQMPHHEHLKDESRARKYLEQKITHALHKFEDFVRHVEVRFLLQEHFHREKPGSHKKAVRAKVPKALQGEGIEAYEDLTADVGGPRMPAPYQIKIVVSMKNHKKVVYSNPEKHAQTTLTECMDLAVDGISHLLREEKARTIQKNRKSKDGEMDVTYSSQVALDHEEAELQAQAVQQTLDMQDAVMEKMYEAVETGAQVEEMPTVKQAARAAATAPAVTAKQEKLDKGDENPATGVQDLLLR